MEGKLVAFRKISVPYVFYGLFVKAIRHKKNLYIGILVLLMRFYAGEPILKSKINALLRQLNVEGGSGE